MSPLAATLTRPAARREKRVDIRTTSLCRANDVLWPPQLVASPAPSDINAAPRHLRHVPLASLERCGSWPSCSGASMCRSPADGARLEHAGSRGPENADTVTVSPP